MPGAHMAFQFIPKVFSGVEVRDRCRTLKVFISKRNTPCLHDGIGLGALVPVQGNGDIELYVYMHK